MKHLNSSLLSLIVGVIGMMVVALSDDGWVHNNAGIILCIASIILMLSLPYYINVLEQSTKAQKFFMGFGLFVFSADLLYYHIFLWVTFIVFFLFLYRFLWLVKNLDVGTDEMPYQYFFRKKQYLKRTLYTIFPYILVYLVVMFHFG